MSEKDQHAVGKCVLLSDSDSALSTSYGQGQRLGYYSLDFFVFSRLFSSFECLVYVVIAGYAPIISHALIASKSAVDLSRALDWGDENEANQLADVLDLSGSEEQIYESDEDEAAEVDELENLLDWASDMDKETTEKAEEAGDGDAEGHNEADGGDKAGVDEKTVAAESNQSGADEGEGSTPKEEKEEVALKFKDARPPSWKSPRSSSRRRIRKNHRRSVSLTVPDMDGLLSSPKTPGTDPDASLVKHLRSKSQDVSTPNFFGLFESDEEKEETQDTFKSLSLDVLLRSASKSSQKPAKKPEPEPEAESKDKGKSKSKKPRRTHSRAKSMLSIPTEFLNEDEMPMSDEAPSPGKHLRSKTFPLDDATDFTSLSPSPRARPSRAPSRARTMGKAREHHALHAFAAEASFRLSMSARNFSRKSSRAIQKATSLRARKPFKGHGYDHYRRSLKFAPKTYMYDHHGWGYAGVLQFQGKRIAGGVNACSKLVVTHTRMIGLIVVPLMF